MNATVRPTRLVMVTADNNNKFYNMTPAGTSEFLAEWGRIGESRVQKKTYPTADWDRIYKEKTKKGYEDVTHLFLEAATKKTFKDITDTQVSQLVTKLLAYSKKSVQENYTISSEAVTASQVSEAQGLLNELAPLISIGAEKDVINKSLLRLYSIIPRRMKNVRNHLVSVDQVQSDDELTVIRTLVDNEQKTLDVMSGQVQMQTNTSDTETEQSILDVLGVTIEVGADSDRDFVRNMMQGDGRELRQVYLVKHLSGYQQYTDRMMRILSDKTTNPKTEKFWHGSRNENWISILQSGLKIRPSNAVLTGSMFGDGIYYADKYRKSAGYSSLAGAYWTGGNSKTAFLAVMNVHVGKQLEVLRHSSDCYRFNAEYLRNKGNYDSVFAKGGADLRNNEYIVYQENQSTIHYLVEVGT